VAVNTPRRTQPFFVLRGIPGCITTVPQAQAESGMWNAAAIELPILFKFLNFNYSLPKLVKLT